MSNPPIPIPVPSMPPSPPSSNSVRRHHTITAASRTARAAKDIISEESAEQALSNDDEFVGQDWVGTVGPVGEKSSLHRQSSLPTKYHRGFHNTASKSGTATPKINSLAAIAGHEGDEEPWNIPSNYNVQEEEPTSPGATQHVQVIETQAHPQSSASPLSPHFVPPPTAPSPPAGESGVRRHVSLTYANRNKTNQNLKRSGTLQAPVPAHAQQLRQQQQQQQQQEDPSEEEDYAAAYEAYEDPDAYDEEFYAQQQQQQQQGGGYASPLGRSSPWSAANDWRASGPAYAAANQPTSAIDDVQRALSALEIASNAGGFQSMAYGPPYPQTGQSVHPPRFNPTHGPPPVPGRPSGNGRIQQGPDFEGRRTPSNTRTGTTAYQQQYANQQQFQQGLDNRGWDQAQKDRLATRTSNPNLNYSYQQQGGHTKSASSGSNPGGAPSGSGNGGGVVPAVPPIPQQYLQQSQGRPGLGVSTNFGSGGNSNTGGGTGQTPVQGAFLNTPVDVQTLMTTKGYNPPQFDTRPQFARYFVIKSYTEDDVHKSLKYEIWSSTEPGNKRLDKAFKETAGRGPIYLFFSVNASGHFCGMAEMLTPVDYTRSSTVWASDKWKGVFKVRWIFVRDIPNVNLRHIKLNNTQERKPVTNSRDTQELLPDAGLEMLRIFHTHPARTSLLQDFAFYELQAMQKMQQQQGSTSGNNSQSPTPAMQSPQIPPATVSTAHLQQSNFGNLNAMPYQMSPMMQMQMQMGMNMGMGSQFGLQQSQAMHQSVMRHPSPGPSPPPQGGQQQQGFMGMPTF
ncbi:YT521-B-like domain-containing protein [Cyathus striatus]|nr:YT521-B-like domain-containing protein [Cyathus striatus]